jgi:hypothetical protein
MTIIRRDPARVAAAIARRLEQDRVAAVGKANAQIGRIRTRFITALPGQDLIYKAKEDEARAYLAAGEPEDLDGFPFLAAEVGVLAPTAGQVAQIWLNLGDHWRAIAASLEGLRMAAVNALAAARSDDEMAQITDALAEQLRGIGGN